MRIQEQKQQNRRTRRRVPPNGGDGHVAAADADIARMAAAQAAARATEREARVATAAYFRAQKRGFAPGHELDDWLAAEAEIAADMPSAFVTMAPLIEAGRAS